MDDGSACPYCGARSTAPSLSKRMSASGQWKSRGWMNKAGVAVAVLVAVNVWFVVTREVGPDRDLEALHSGEEAVRVCGEAVESRLAARNPSIVGPGRPDYLQGGEYEVRLAIELRDGARRTRNEVVCELQFRAGSWRTCLWVRNDQPKRLLPAEFGHFARRILVVIVVARPFMLDVHVDTSQVGISGIPDVEGGERNAGRV